MKYLALDIGNVLCRVDFDRFLNTLSKRMNITIDEGTYFLKRTQKLHDMGLTELEFELRDHFKIRSEAIISELLQEWKFAVVGYNTVLSAIDSWKEKYDLKIALLSNVGLEHANQMGQILYYGNFYQEAIKHYSCFVGARKPSLIYYQSFLQQHPEFTGCIYVDDLAENLEASKKFGFKTFQFDLNSKNYYEQLTLLEEMIKNS